MKQLLVWTSDEFPLKAAFELLVLPAMLSNTFPRAATAVGQPQTPEGNSITEPLLLPQMGSSLSCLFADRLLLLIISCTSFWMAYCFIDESKLDKPFSTELLISPEFEVLGSWNGSEEVSWMCGSCLALLTMEVKLLCPINLWWEPRSNDAASSAVVESPLWFIGELSFVLLLKPQDAAINLLLSFGGSRALSSCSFPLISCFWSLVVAAPLQ